jgi:hypothetical protein
MSNGKYLLLLRIDKDIVKLKNTNCTESKKHLFFISVLLLIHFSTSGQMYQPRYEQKEEVVFDGDETYIDFNDSTLDYSRGVSIFLTFKTTSYKYQWLAAKYSYKLDAGWHLFIKDGKLSFCGRNGTGKYHCVETTRSFDDLYVVDGKWHRVVVQINSRQDEWFLYVDGVRIGKAYVNSKPSQNASMEVLSPLVLGRYLETDHGYSASFKGSIKDFKLVEEFFVYTSTNIVEDDYQCAVQGIGCDRVEREINEIRSLYYQLDQRKLSRLEFDNYTFYHNNGQLKKAVFLEEKGQTRTEIEFRYDRTYNSKDTAYFVFVNSGGFEDRYYYSRKGKLIKWLDDSKEDVFYADFYKYDDLYYCRGEKITAQSYDAYRKFRTALKLSRENLTKSYLEARDYVIELESRIDREEKQEPDTTDGLSTETSFFIGPDKVKTSSYFFTGEHYSAVGHTVYIPGSNKIIQKVEGVSTYFTRNAYSQTVFLPNGRELIFEYFQMRDNEWRRNCEVFEWEYCPLLVEVK